MWKRPQYKIECPNCQSINYLTTDKFDPAVSCTPDMLKVKDPSVQPIAALRGHKAIRCPSCGAQLAPAGYLTTVPPVKDGDWVWVGKGKPDCDMPGTVKAPEMFCEACGYTAKTKAAWARHLKSKKHLKAVEAE